MSKELRRTPFYPLHREAGGRLVPFAGWEMPVQFPHGIIHEHQAVRQRAGLFDVSHMGRFYIRGREALDFVNRLITNDLGKIGPHQLLYSAVCNEAGGILDDVTVYHLGQEVLVVANASNAAKIRAWIEQHQPAGITLEDATERLAQLALQGPQAEALLEGSLAEAVRGLGYYEHTRVEWDGVGVLISRNGYTGEDGFEIYIPRERALDFWKTLMTWGAARELIPVGLGARDSLRMEVNYALYGNELSEEVTPLEAGLRWVVKFKSGGDFVGREALLRQRGEGLRRSLIGFAVEGKRLPRHGYPVLQGETQVGVVTSGGYCPSLARGMGMGLVAPACKAPGTRLEIDARGTRLAATVAERPFYKNGSVRKG